MNPPLKRHPILRAERVRASGEREVESRVYCDVRRRAVSVDTCRQCLFCVAEESNEIRCSPAPELLPTAALSAGAALSRGAVVIDEDVFVRDVVSLFVEKRPRMLVIADASGRAGGVIHESRLVREIQDATYGGPRPLRLGWDASSLEPASSVTSVAVTVAESLPLREALLKMANARQRQLLVVDEQGHPIGLLWDVDALHGLRTPSADDNEHV